MNNNNANKKRNPLKKRLLRYPGQSLDYDMGNLQQDIYILLFVSVISVVLAVNEWVQWFLHLPPSPLVPSIGAAAIVAYSSVKIWRLRKRLSNYELGQMGEREVAQILDKLKLKGYTVFHDVLAPDFNIDHVVISPRGIFAVETKTYSKPGRGEAKVTFDGENVTLTGHRPDPRPVMEAVRHAAWLRNSILKDSIVTKKLFEVKPVVVFTGWWVPKGYSKDIWVLNPGMIEIQIEMEPISLTDVDIAIAIARLEPYSTTSTDDSTGE